MIDLLNFYLEKISSEDYYFQFYESISNINMTYDIFKGYVESGSKLDFQIYDTDEAIEKYKSLCQPDISFDDENRIWFLLLSFYLFKSGYTIEQFPDVLKRPPSDPQTFTYNTIRRKAFALDLNDGNTIRYETRRQIVDNMIFKKTTQSIDPGKNIDELIRKISTRDAHFEEMELDEKLKELANLIENMLKTKDKYLELDYKPVAFDFLNNATIIKYRNQLQCFRHSSEESIKQRKQLDEKQKMFLVDYGIIICKTIYIIKRDTDTQLGRRGHTHQA